MAEIVVTTNFGASYLGLTDTSDNNVELFEVSFYDSDIDVAAPKEFYLKTVGTAKVSLRYFIHGYGAARVEVFENPEVGADGSEGTLRASYNTNRNSSVAATMLVKEDPSLSGTGATTGTLLRNHLVALNSSPVELPGIYPLGLRYNTSYLIRVTPISNDDWLSFVLVWAEQ